MLKQPKGLSGENDMKKSKNDIYYIQDTTRTFAKTRTFVKKKDIGKGRLNGQYLWQEVKKILWFYIPVKEPFWLDDYGFTKLIKK